MIFRLISLLVAIVFASGIASGQISNDICTDAILVTVDNICVSYNNDGATNSANPFDGLTCGFANEGAPDLWFKTIVPSSGNLTIETEMSSTNGLSNVDLEVYTGNCSDLQARACNATKDLFNGQDLHARIELEGLTVGDTIFIRAITLFGLIGDFDLCVSDMGYTYECRVEHIELGVQSQCDPETNTFSQEFVVYYQSNGDATGLFINGSEFSLTGSPQTIEVHNIVAHGEVLDVRAWLFRVSSSEPSVCRINSSYRGFNFFTAANNCFSGDVPNDDCTGAIELSINSFCQNIIGDNTGATISTDVEDTFQCGNTGAAPLDVWYKFVVPPSGDLIVATYFVPGSLLTPLYEIYEGSCGILNFLAAPCDNTLESVRLVNQTPGDTLFVRVVDRAGESQGEFGICILEPERFTNDICHDAINVPVTSQSNELVFSNHMAQAEESPYSVSTCDDSDIPSRDLWFNVTVPSTGTLQLLAHDSERGLTNLIMEVFEGDCDNLIFIDCEERNSNGQTLLILTSLTPNSDLYIRISSSGSGSQSNVSFDFHALGLMNNICSGGFVIPPDGICRRFNNIGYTNSGNPNPGLVCGFLNAGEGDVWFKSVVPNSGRLTVESNMITLLEADLEVYSGNCNDLSVLACSDSKNLYDDFVYHPRVELEGLPVGDTIFIRLIGPFGDLGDFELCVSDSGYSYPCRIQHIALGATTDCDVDNNTYSQEFFVHYQSDGTARFMSVQNKTVMLTGSPQRVVIDGISINDITPDMKATLWNTSSNEITNCRRNSLFQGDDFYTAPEECFVIKPENDECAGAIMLFSDEECIIHIGDNTGATLSSGVSENLGCISLDSTIQDVWFKMIVPFSGEFVVRTFKTDIVNPRFEIYEGTCQGLSLIPLTCGFPTNPILLSRRIPGDTLYIRVADFRGISDDDQGEFGICVESICTSANHITQDLSSDPHFKHHISITADNKILSGANVIYDARQCIELQSDFEIEENATFEIRLDGCE